MAPLRTFLARRVRRYRKTPHVRPFALAVPILVLLVSLPLLRPLRHPDQVSVDEQVRLATVAALVEHATAPETPLRASPIGSSPLAARLAIDYTRFPASGHLIQVDRRLYSDQPPVMALLLAGPYWVMHRMGFALRDYSVLVPYILTLLAATLPTAGVAGLVYRMARIFELPRIWRMSLAGACVFGTGLISYAVVLNPHAPAAALVLGAAGCLVHLTVSRNPGRGGGWLALAGLCAATAAVIDPPAAIFLVPLACVIPAMRWRPSLKVGGVLLYLLGAAPPILMHTVLTVPITGDVWPGFMHPELTARLPTTKPTSALAAAPDDAGDEDAAGAGATAAQSPTTSESDETDYGDDAAPVTRTTRFFHGVGRFFGALLGSHGAVSHFPIVALGIFGMAAVMHRHWPPTTKVLATATAFGAGAILFAWAAAPAPGSAGFANRWFIVFLPITLFWAGAWVRRKHHPAAWATAGALLVFSVIVSLIGATDPLPRGGYSGYTAYAALKHLFVSDARPAVVVRNRG